MKISLGNLAKAGRQGMVPTVMQATYYRRTGVNPVAAAIWLMDRRWSFLQTTCVAIGLVLASAVMASSSLFPETDFHTVVFMYLFFSSVPVLGHLLWLYLDQKPVSKDNLSLSAGSFCRDLGLFLTWAMDCNYLKEVEFDEYWCWSEAKLKEASTAILVHLAVEKIRFEEKDRIKNPDNGTRRAILSTFQYEEFSRRYATLESLGLVSGGHDKFYKIAEKIVQEAQDRAPVVRQPYPRSPYHAS